MLVQLILLCSSPLALSDEYQDWQSFVIIPDKATVRFTDVHHLETMDKALKADFIDKTVLRSFGFLSGERADAVKERLKAKILGILHRVQLILGMHLKRVKLDLFLFETRQDFDRFYLTTFGFPSPAHSIYKQERNAIYLTLSELTTGVLAHEMGHFVICTYCLVPPPANAQEIMCQYLDQHIRERTFQGLIISQ
ncbi:hypothetical protein KAW18_18200 [candidate division WOR-3 bacterium]|nr:hypothetical protein [candidate division WOR-3 bacterium]